MNDDLLRQLQKSIGLDNHIYTLKERFSTLSNNRSKWVSSSCIGKFGSGTQAFVFLKSSLGFLMCRQSCKPLV